jgi:hypothetical protein
MINNNHNNPSNIFYNNGSGGINSSYVNHNNLSNINNIS